MFGDYVLKNSISSSHHDILFACFNRTLHQAIRMSVSASLKDKFGSSSYFASIFLD